MTKCDGACFSAARTGIAAEIFVATSFSNAVFVLSVIWKVIMYHHDNQIMLITTKHK